MRVALASWRDLGLACEAAKGFDKSLWIYVSAGRAETAFSSLASAAALPLTAFSCAICAASRRPTFFGGLLRQSTASEPLVVPEKAQPTTGMPFQVAAFFDTFRFSFGDACALLENNRSLIGKNAPASPLPSHCPLWACAQYRPLAANHAGAIDNRSDNNRQKFLVGAGQQVLQAKSHGPKLFVRHGAQFLRSGGSSLAPTPLSAGWA